MTRLSRRLLALLVLVRAAGFTSIVAVVWFRGQHATGEIAVILTAFGVGSVLLPAAAGLLLGERPLRPVLVATLVLNGAALMLLPLTAGASLALPTAAMFAIGASSSLARSLIGTLLTVAAPADRQARTQSIISWSANVGGVVATGIAGLVAASGSDLGPLFAVEGAVLLVAASLIPRAAAVTRAAPSGAPGIRGTVTRLRSALVLAAGATAVMQGLGMQFALTTATPESYVYAALTNVVLLIVAQPVVLRVVRDASAPAYLVAGFAGAAVTAVAVAATDSWLVFGVAWTACELLLTAGMVPAILARTPASLHVAALGVVGSSWGLTAALMPPVIAAAVTAAGATGSWGVFVAIGVVASLGSALAIGLRPGARPTEGRDDREEPVLG
ncbi:MFS permease [Clavibacter sepedonicus]|uniref:MFS permease n=1 Tax=Clavibacter TaxID=1573 RepID=UPI0002D81F32|nr:MULTISPECIES: MFS permease [Clavibacter]MBD5383297.1 MFS transporter [Clavibacter sp.]